MDKKEKKESQEQIAEAFERRFKGQLEGRIEYESKSLEEQFAQDFYLHDNDEFPDELKEDLENRLFSLKSKIVKACLAAHKNFINKINRNYQRELNYSKIDKYVLGVSPHWMMDDGRIVRTLKI